MQLSPFTRLTALSFFLFLSFSAAIEVSCRSGHVARPDSNSLFRVQPIDKEKRLMKYYATRKYMPAHAALPLIRTRENRPFQSQGARWTANSAMQRYIVSISSFRRPDLRSDLRTFPRSAPFPSLISPSFVSPRSGHTLCMTHHFVVVRTGRILVWYSALTTRHFRCGSGSVLGPRVGRVYVVLSSDPTIRIRATYRENSS